MAKKKTIINDALVTLKEVEEAAFDNAKDIMIEAFAPAMTKFFKEAIDGEFGDEEEDEFEVDDEELEEGTEHDSGKEPDAGREDTDASGEELNEEKEDDGLPGDQEEIDIDDDGDVDAEDLANLRAGKKDDDIKNEALSINVSEADEDEDEEDPEHEAGESDEEEAAEEDAEEKGEPEPDDDDDDEGSESDDDSESDLEIPDELFDDSEEEVDDDMEKDDIELSDDLDEEDDEELDLDIEDDEIDDLEATDSDELETDDEEEVEEGLYIRKEGEFKKITPEEYLNIRKGELEEENEKLTKAIGALQGQLKETHLFNAKLAHVNKLFATGEFTKQEKTKFVEQIDECESIKEVKALYESTIKELKRDINPLDDFHAVLREHRNRPKLENVFESPEMIRMKRMAGMDKT